jgi:hypothetical protein
MITRPTTTGSIGGSLCSTPSAADSIALLGGERYESVAFSYDECSALQRLYGVDTARAEREARAFAEAEHQEAMARHKAAMAKRDPWDRPLPAPALEADGTAAFAVAGAGRNLFRHAEADGLRMVAAMARFLQPGDDPVRALVALMAEAGWDVREDPDWYNGEDAEKYL